MQTTTHEWCYDLNQTMQNYVHSIKNEISFFLYNTFFMNQTSHVIKPIDEMDELYHSKPENNIGSDNVFITPHIDGFLGWIPFMRCWRCIYCLTNPNNTTTFLPFNNPDENTIVIKPKNFICHDFNRDLHWIQSGHNNPHNESRIVFKLHFYDYPTFMKPFAKVFKFLNLRYNSFARSKFLHSINPYKNAQSYALSFFINSITILGGYTELFIGIINLAIIFLVYKGVYRNSFRFHCFMEYISCYICMTQTFIRIIPPGVFWRDLLIYKCLSFLFIYPKNKLLFTPSSITSFILCISIGISQYQKKTQELFYYQQFQEFSDFHQNKYNICFHILTTSICYLGLFASLQKFIRNKPFHFPQLICAIYWISNKYSIPDKDVAGISTILFTVYAFIVNKYMRKVTLMQCFMLFNFGIFAQELSHYYFDEETYLSSYRKNNNWIKILFLHTYWLVPFEIRALLNL